MTLNGGLANLALTLSIRGHCSLIAGVSEYLNSLWPSNTLNYATELNISRLRQNGRHFPDAIFQCIFLNRNIKILIKFLLKFVPYGPINNIPALGHIRAWRRPGDTPLFEPIMVGLLTHICVIQPQWFKTFHFLTSDICMHRLFETKWNIHAFIITIVGHHWFRCNGLLPVWHQDIIYSSELHTVGTNSFNNSQVQSITRLHVNNIDTYLETLPERPHDYM